MREQESQPQEFTLVREVIQVASVRSFTLEDGYGYIRIAQFQNDSGSEVIKAVKKLREEGELDGLILDLRNNPGGVLQSAVEVSDVFIDDGLIVYTSGRLSNSTPCQGKPDLHLHRTALHRVCANSTISPLPPHPAWGTQSLSGICAQMLDRDAVADCWSKCMAPDAARCGREGG